MDQYLVALSILGLQLAWGSVADEAAVDHDGQSVAKGLRFVHSVSGQQYRGVFEMLEYLEETSSGNGIDSGGWFIQELYFGVRHE